MVYEKQNFTDGQVLTAAQLNHIEEGVAEAHALVAALASSRRVADVTLLAADWVGDTFPYSQVLTIDGITENSQVDLTPSVEQLTIFYEKDLSFVTENEDGVVTAYAFGDKPTNDYTMQVTITEVGA